MTNIQEVYTVHDYNQWVGAIDYHPLVSVVCYDELPNMRNSFVHFGVYGLFLRDDPGDTLRYGSKHYNYEAGSLICVSPGQFGGAENEDYAPHIRGWALLFDSALLRGTTLERRIEDYGFLGYNSNEALVMKPDERETIVGCMRCMREEMNSQKDAVQDKILVAYIELVLNYCLRFYNRQISEDVSVANDLQSRIISVVRQYYEQGRQLREGFPSVKWVASELCFSSNYLGDLCRKVTGLSPKTIITDFIVQRAKGLLQTGESISNVAYELGFNYPQHFTRSFTKITGMTPSQYQSTTSLKTPLKQDFQDYL
ncbi:MAG: helix-turn-helix transcriptional regulator [Bacteroidota bacterium]|nr:helix-turn-helix transcriptional regulator [Bacteroidota bacterium]